MKQYLVYLLLGSILAPVIQFIEKYVFNDWEFLILLSVITMADTALGVFKALKYRELSSRRFAAVINKIVVYGAAMIATHVLVHLKIAGKPYVVFAWFDYVVFAAIVVREAISIFENIAAIDPDAFPPSLLRYLKQFDSITGKEKLSKSSTEETL